MTLERLAALSPAQLSSQLVLGNWYQFVEAEFTKTLIPDNPKGTFSVAFGAQLDGENFEDILNFLNANNILVSSVCRYQPDPMLAPAICFYSNDYYGSLNPLVMNEFAHAKGFQLVQLSTPPNLNEPGLLVMDMDSTAITIECIDEIAKLAGVGEEVAAVTASAMRGELDFAESLHARVATLKGAPQSVITDVASKLPLMPGLESLVSCLKQHHWKTAIVSGGFTAMTEALKEQLGLDITLANNLDIKDAKLSGTVSGKVIDAQAKADAVLDLSKQFNIPMSQTIAMGDGANDLKMMAVASLGVAFHAKPLVCEQADVSVGQGGLDQLLYLIG